MNDDYAKLADTIQGRIERSRSRNGSIAPALHYGDGGPDESPMVIAALRAYAPHVERISELLRFNNEFEERARVAERQNRALRALLAPFAAEADNWADSVPDDYQSLCSEPGSENVLPGSETAFTVGDMRRAREGLNAVSAADPDLERIIELYNRVKGGEETALADLGTWPALTWWEAASVNAEFTASLGEWVVTFRSPRGNEWREAGVALRGRKPSP